jgi:hypothetical protein
MLCAERPAVSMTGEKERSVDNLMDGSAVRVLGGLL